MCKGPSLGLFTKRTIAVALAVVATLAVLPARASAQEAADDPLFVPWSDLLPGLTSAYDPTSENLCVRGDLRCVDAVIREMNRRFRPLAESCDHDALFALTYLRTTEEYRRTVSEDPNFFSDTAFVNHEDAVFASYYFEAYDDWHAGRAAEVPSAWAIALQAADERRVSGAGNILLGVNAHVNRDLPFVLAAIGLVKPDGSSRKPDHDKVNRILNRVYGPLLAEAARRFDPSISSPAAEGTTLDDTTLLQLVVSWREDAWRNAERLVAAATPAERELVAASIEAAAAEEARSLAESTAYRDPVTGSAARDAYCAEHWNDG
ncbi:MAG: DUF5995 family protein [Actinomycetota bacterium]|nr:DUF5995 family protein [Actinomycetota bacterium]